MSRGFANQLRGTKLENVQQNKKLDKKTAMHVIRRLSKYVLKHKLMFLAAIILTLISNQLSLMGPMFTGSAVDAMVGKGGVDFAAVRENVIKMLGCYLVAGVLSYVMAVLMIHISQKIVYTMRKELFEKLTTLPVGYFDSHPAGDIISRISYDIDTVNASLSNDLVQVMTSIYTVVGSLIFMWQISKPMIVVFCVTVPVSILFTRYRSKKVRPAVPRAFGKAWRAQRLCRGDAVGRQNHLRIRQGGGDFIPLFKEEQSHHGRLLQRRILRRNAGSVGKLYK